MSNRIDTDSKAALVTAYLYDRLLQYRREIEIAQIKHDNLQKVIDKMYAFTNDTINNMYQAFITDNKY